MKYVIDSIIVAVLVVLAIFIHDYCETTEKANYMEGQVLLSCLEHEGERTAEAKESLIIYMSDGKLTQGEQDHVIQEAGRLLTIRCEP